MSFYATDLYYAQRSYPLDEVQNDILTYLYMPIIGIKAYSLYMIVYNEAKRMDRFHRPCAISRLLSYLSFSIEEFEESVKALEATGLLKTYVKVEESTYLFDVRSPLTLRQFFRNAIFVTILRQTLGTDEFTKTCHYFRVAKEDLKGYEEREVKFTDVYEIDISQVRPLRMRGSYFERKEGNVDVDYDMDLFYEAIKDNQIPKRQVKIHEETIKQLAVVYSIDPLTLSSLVRESYIDKKVNMQMLADKIKAYYSMDTSDRLNDVYLTQPENFKTHDHEETAIARHLRYLESISPYELLKSKQGGKEPVLRDLSLAETLMVHLGLTPGVTNVLLEYVMGKNDGRLPKAYTETIGASWARKHIKTAKQAYEAAMTLEPVKEDKQPEVKEVIPESNPQELIDLINKMKGENHD